MKKLVYVFIALIAVCIALSACGQDSGDNANLMTISTSVCDLKYPSKWKDTVQIDMPELSVETVRFSMEGVSVFDISFGEGDLLLGTLKNNEETTDVYVLFYELDENDKDYDTYAKMQDDVNVITENLTKDYDFTVGAPLLEDNGETFEVNTELVTLQYPKRWENRVTIQAEEEKVSFSCDGTSLFVLYFGGEEGELLGTYDGTELRVVTDDFDSDSITSEQYAEYSAMQEDVNVILAGLFEDEKFKLPY